MGDSSNAELARSAWQAVSVGDTDELLALLDPALVWHATARNTPWSGNHGGHEAVIDYLATVGESVEAFDARLDDVLVSADRVALIFHVSASRGDRSLSVDYQLLARVVDERIVEIWTTALDPEALDAFWS